MTAGGKAMSKIHHAPLGAAPGQPVGKQGKMFALDCHVKALFKTEKAQVKRALLVLLRRSSERQ
jgi:hypothetical protein